MQQAVLFGEISKELNILAQQVENTVKLLEEGCTVPFISRYRKERTGSLDEVQIQFINKRFAQWQELLKRKSVIIKSIAETGNLSEELKNQIQNCRNLTELEDLYLPFKKKRRTRAEVAKSRGLTPLADLIFRQTYNNIAQEALKFVKGEVTSAEDALAGARDIIAERIAEDVQIRNIVRNIFAKTASFCAKAVKGKEQEGEKYSNYFDFSLPLKKCGSHQILALFRGESEGYLKLSLEADDDIALERIGRFLIKNRSESAAVLRDAYADGYKRLLRPSIENEYRGIAKISADEDAIEMFARNVKQLLFAPPLGNKRVLAIDPGFRTGCKFVCLDGQGNLLYNDVIYPTPPKNETILATKKILQCVESYKIDAIAVGNGTASRETERFLSAIKFRNDIKIYIVSENGASIYSASKIAREEFPDKDVTVRGAVSIGRRLLDPLAELVKIDPKSIGVGQYQHDVDQQKLKESLDFTVQSCVNSVGVNVNTASKQLLTYVAGLGPQLAQNILDYRLENGDFASRSELKSVKRMGEKAFQQCAAFLRIPDSCNLLDNSAVHPESYKIVEKMAEDCGCSVADLMADKSQREKIDIKRYITKDCGEPTLFDIVNELEKPGRDPRKAVEVMEFDDNIKEISDLKEGLELNGIITNITQFGVFVDIGVHENGLVHISEICDKFISSPAEVVNLHEHVRVKVIGVDFQRKRISLSMKGLRNE